MAKETRFTKEEMQEIVQMVRDIEKAEKAAKKERAKARLNWRKIGAAVLAVGLAALVLYVALATKWGASIASVLMYACFILVVLFGAYQLSKWLAGKGAKAKPKAKAKDKKGKREPEPEPDDEDEDL